MINNLKTRKVRIVGLEHYCSSYYIENLSNGTPIVLCQEPQNEFDRNAVAVYCKDYKIGYVKRQEAKEYHDQFLHRMNGVIVWSSNGDCKAKIFDYVDEKLNQEIFSPEELVDSRIQLTPEYFQCNEFFIVEGKMPNTYENREYLFYYRTAFRVSKREGEHNLRMKCILGSHEFVIDAPGAAKFLSDSKHYKCFVLCMTKCTEQSITYRLAFQEFENIYKREKSYFHLIDRAYKKLEKEGLICNIDAEKEFERIEREKKMKDFPHKDRGDEINNIQKQLDQKRFVVVNRKWGWQAFQSPLDFTISRYGQKTYEFTDTIVERINKWPTDGFIVLDPFLPELIDESKSKVYNLINTKDKLVEENKSDWMLVYEFDDDFGYEAMRNIKKRNALYAQMPENIVKTAYFEHHGSGFKGFGVDVVLLCFMMGTHIMNKENANELFDEIAKKSENVENFILYLQEHSIPFHKYKVYHDERRTESERVEKNAIGFYTN